MNARERFRTRLAAGPLLADGAMGTLLYLARRPAAGQPRRARRDPAGPDRRDPPRVPRRRRRADRDGHVRGQPGPAGRARDGRSGGRVQPARRTARPRGARRLRARGLGGGLVGPLGAPTRELLHLPDAAVRAAVREQLDGLLEGGVDLFVFETFIAPVPPPARRRRGAPGGRPADRRPADLRRGAPAAGRHVPAARRGRPAGGRRRRRRGQLRRRSGGLRRGARGDGRGRRRHPGSRRACVRSCPTPGCRSGSRASSSTPRAPTTSARSSRASSPPGRPSSVAAAGRRPSTSPRCGGARRAAGDAGGRRRRATAATPRPARPTSPRTAPRHDDPVRDRRPPSPAAPDRAPSAPPPTALARALAGGRYVISVEIDPPRSVRIERTIEAARLLADAGVDLVNVSDSAMARVRMGALAVAFGIQHDLDLECIVHFTTRDRNLMALESELLGAHALGRPQHPRPDRRPAAGRRLPVGHRRLGRRLDRARRDPGPAQPRRGRRRQPDRPAGRVHHRLRPRSDGRRHGDRVGPPRAQARRRRPPGHDPAALRPGRRSRPCSPRPGVASGPAGSRCPLLLGVLPLQSSRHAEFLHNEVPGITIPDAVRTALREAGDRGAEVGLEHDPVAARGCRTRVSRAPTSCQASDATSRRPSWSAGSGLAQGVPA